jgi:hypothetical protein
MASRVSVADRAASMGGLRKVDRRAPRPGRSGGRAPRPREQRVPVGGAHGVGVQQRHLRRRPPEARPRRLRRWSRQAARPGSPAAPRRCRRVALAAAIGGVSNDRSWSSIVTGTLLSPPPRGCARHHLRRRVAFAQMREAEKRSVLPRGAGTRSGWCGRRRDRRERLGRERGVARIVAGCRLVAASSQRCRSSSSGVFTLRR